MPKTKGSKNKGLTKPEEKLLNKAKLMPPLYHTLPGKKFDINDSEVINWLMEQEETKQFVFNCVCNKGEDSKVIRYDSSTCKWKGINYDD